MVLNFFKKKSDSFLGIDIGTHSIKIVEISGRRGKIKLENYGELASKILYEKPFRVFKEKDLLLSSDDISDAISAIIKESKIHSKKAIFSIPDFSTFFTNFDLPAMSEKEIHEAVKYEARLHVPIPLTEVNFDWKLIEGSPSERTPLKILLVSVPNDVIKQYQEIAEISDLNLKFLEAEVFGLTRVLGDDEENTIALIDIGAQSMSINIVDKGVLKTSHSFDLSGNKLTYQITRALNVDYEQAEELKKKHGIGLLGENKEGPGKEVQKTILPLVDMVLNEIKKISDNFEENERKKISKVVLSGGTSLLPGLKEYFAENLEKKIEIADPFSKIYCPPVLQKTLKKMGPSYAIAVGVALRGLE